MEVILEQREHIIWQRHLRRFYYLKGLCFTLSFIFFICSASILSKDKQYYSLCPNPKTGEHIKASLILLIIYHAFDMAALSWEVYSIKRRDGGGVIKAIFKVNQVFGIFAYLFLQIVYFKEDTMMCIDIYFVELGLDTQNWMVAEIVYFYIFFIQICGLGCYLSYQQYKTDRRELREQL